MAVTVTQKDFDVWGKYFVCFAKLALDTSYPTGGYGSSLGLAPSTFGMRNIFGFHILGVNAAGAVVAQLTWDYTNNKLMAYRVATFTPAGTVVGNVTVGGGAAGEALGITPDSNAGALTKAAATARTIPIATFLGAAPTVTGTAQGQVAFAQVSNAVNLSAVTARIQVIGNPY